MGLNFGRESIRYLPTQVVILLLLGLDRSFDLLVLKARDSQFVVVVFNVLRSRGLVRKYVLKHRLVRKHVSVGMVVRVPWARLFGRWLDGRGLELRLRNWGDQVALPGEMILRINDNLGDARVVSEFVRVLFQEFVCLLVSALSNAVLEGLRLHHIFALQRLLLLLVVPLLWLLCCVA